MRAYVRACLGHEDSGRPCCRPVPWFPSRSANQGVLYPSIETTGQEEANFRVILVLRGFFRCMIETCGSPMLRLDGTVWPSALHASGTAERDGTQNVSVRGFHAADRVPGCRNSCQVRCQGV